MEGRLIIEREGFKSLVVNVTKRDLENLPPYFTFGEPQDYTASSPFADDKDDLLFPKSMILKRGDKTNRIYFLPGSELPIYDRHRIMVYVRNAMMMMNDERYYIPQNVLGIPKWKPTRRVYKHSKPTTDTSTLSSSPVDLMNDFLKVLGNKDSEREEDSPYLFFIKTGIPKRDFLKWDSNYYCPLVGYKHSTLYYFAPDCRLNDLSFEEEEMDMIVFKHVFFVDHHLRRHLALKTKTIDCRSKSAAEIVSMMLGCTSLYAQIADFPN